ncbi:replication initiation factor domain-containing protein [Leucothrix pacifica]|uniref:Replication initiation protein-like C-terminal domain-containing protein n=1 Tax=Leucothrix pacifica TaxID=1247513 RepID=A0A317CJR9_9GAMM|nr:replication initiation factor domain-containing protein [Leucothrix pacifica]PWQ97683.1 hypothetical protein DKW60_09915 [Leucothrix pacifica]
MMNLPKGHIEKARKHRNQAKELQAEREALQSLKSNNVGGMVVGDMLQGVDFKGAQSATYPPYCNTGGYGLPTKKQAKNGLQVTKIDWLRATCTDLESFISTMSDVDSKGGILDQANVIVRWTEKGLHGYDQSAKLLLQRDNDNLTIGHIAMAEAGRNKGGMIELTGVGCKWLQLQYPDLWLELYSLFIEFEWRFSRIDIALDLDGEYCLEHGYTVPSLYGEAINNGLFKSDKLRNPNMKQTSSIAGDWSTLLVGGVTPESYDPIEHCPAGLTAYIGSRKGSADFFRIYEKGKELLGAEAEPESMDRAWVRVEHEMSRKGTGREIPLDVMLRPDEYFALDRSGVRQLMHEYRASLSLERVQQVQLSNFQREKSLSIAKKVYWAKHSYGRLLKTLQDEGLELQQIIDWLTRSDGLKEFIFDVQEVAA